MDKIQPYIQSANQALAKYPLLVKLDTLSGIPSMKLYVVIAVYLVYSISMFFDLGAQLLSTVFTLGYPLRKLVEAHSAKEFGGLQRWSLYFAIISVWGLLELIMLPETWVPFYYLLKTVGVAWLVYPRFNGMAHVQQFLEPHLAALKPEAKKE